MSSRYESWLALQRRRFNGAACQKRMQQYLRAKRTGFRFQASRVRMAFNRYVFRVIADRLVFVKGIPRALVSEPRKDGQRTMVFFVRFSRISKSFQRTLRSGEFNSGDMKNAHRESAASTFDNPTCLVVFVRFGRLEE
ncbi:uncharacterized protein LOC105735512 isoform X2 [Apis florea]|uniref:uncharacterized protein LOC105735512 isoform X2 n=1 Tax=Apis florea TaxID=7463 RepID=UPI0012FF4A14|nr:uncharacterized protein LOC105735512 isoform X2 [Apis florea]